MTTCSLSFSFSSFANSTGVQIRCAFSQKRGWHKFGTRKQIIDRTTPDYGPAVDLFWGTHAEGLERVLSDNKRYRGVDNVIVFLEYFGPSSFGTFHDFTEPFRLSLIDVQITRKGFVKPNHFAKDFSEVDCPPVVYRGTFDEQFIEDVRANKFNTKEGVVAKGLSPQYDLPHGFWVTKVKTRAWLAEVKRRAQDSSNFSKAIHSSPSNSLDGPGILG